MRSIGIQPDILVCRSEHELPDEQRKKIALFTNVNEEAVISAYDVDDLYKIPEMMHQQSLDSIVIKKLKLKTSDANLNEWKSIVRAKTSAKKEINIAMVGKYMDLRDAYISLTEALLHGGIKNLVKVNINYIESQDIEKEGTKLLENVDGIVVPGGFGDRGIEGKIETVRYAREKGVPYLGICLGMQVAIIEAARNLAYLKGAHSTEFNKDTKYPVIALITEWQQASGEIEERDEDSEMGGTMRLGAQEIYLQKNTFARSLYKKGVIKERHRHRYEFNNNFKDSLENAGIQFSGLSVDNLVEMIEITDHPWFVASQFHPEFTSNPRDGHPLFRGFIEAVLKSKEKG